MQIAEDLRQFMNLAWQCSNDVGVHAPDGKIADAKSILGLIALDYTSPVLVVTEDRDFLKTIEQFVIDQDNIAQKTSVGFAHAPLASVSSYFPKILDYLLARVMHNFCVVLP